MCLRHEGLEIGSIEWQEQGYGNHSLPGENTGYIPDSGLCFWFYLVLARTGAESLPLPHHPLIILVVFKEGSCFKESSWDPAAIVPEQNG